IILAQVIMGKEKRPGEIFTQLLKTGLRNSWNKAVRRGTVFQNQQINPAQLPVQQCKVTKLCKQRRQVSRR
ncbi:hypothetical protein HispidOSU_000597, partial [Sigmodon hispidus]